MGRFNEMLCLEIKFDADGEILPFSSPWTHVRHNLDCRNSAFMAPFDDKTLLVYGGIYDPGIERYGYDDEGNREPGNEGFFDDPDYGEERP